MHTFANSHFLKLIEDSGSASPNRGWHPCHFTSKDNQLISYKKDHSYGEYIFDWAWADLYHRMGIEYYPKLIHAIPFTPVNNSKFTTNFDERLTIDAFQLYQQDNLSSAHYLFTDKEYDSLAKLGFFKQITTQYHFINEYESFDNYLTKLKKNKRKTISKERRKVSDYPLHIEVTSSQNLTISELSEIYGLYLTTIDKKNAYAYLTSDFFLGLNTLENCFFHLARSEEGQIIAMAMFFASDTKLYGRYWGIHPLYQQKFEFLHFELCYYMGMEYTINNNLEVFEAGAQGEQKLYRGFKPIAIESYHHLKEARLHQAIEDHVRIQNIKTFEYIRQLEDYLPYKRK